MSSAEGGASAGASETTLASTNANGAESSNNNAGSSNNNGKNTTRNRGKRDDQEKAKKDSDSKDRNSRNGRQGRNNNNNNNNSSSNSHHGHNHVNTSTKKQTDGKATPSLIPPPPPLTAPFAGDETASEAGSEHTCFICTENIVISAVSECNHRTCHLCTLRLRALYKTKNCAYCKAEQGIMIFSRDHVKLFEEYDLKSMAQFDPKLKIYFEDQEMHEDTMILLRFNCPDATCDVACDGWGQLKSHVKKVHKLMLCDLCVRHKKVFAHEHNLFTSSQLMKHFKHGEAGADQNMAEPSGFKGHPECGFCRESFYGDDELFEHCKKNHEQCFICTRHGIRHQYYDKYADLERHLQAEHFACMDPECLEKKFVVFDTDLDLRGHEAEMHPNSTHGQRARVRDARKIDIQFSYSPVSDNAQGANRRRGGGRDEGGRGGSGSRGNGKNRSDAASTPSQPQLTPHQVQQIALQRQMAEEQERKNAEELAKLALESPSAPAEPAQPTMLRTRPPAGFGASLSEPVRAPTPVKTAASVASRSAMVTSSPARRSPAPPPVTNSPSNDWPAVAASSSSASSSSTPVYAKNVIAPQPQRSKGPIPAETLNKHAAFQDRVQQYLVGTGGTLSQFRTLTTQYRNSQIPGNQFVASLSSLFGSDQEKTGKIVQGLYDVLDSESKKAELMRNWRDWKTVHQQFPSLEASSLGHTMADVVAPPAARRVLVIKSSGTTRGGFGHVKPKSTSTWDRAAAAAASINRSGSPTSRQNSTPVFYPTPQLNSSAAWAATDAVETPVVAPKPTTPATPMFRKGLNASPAPATSSSSNWASATVDAPRFQPSNATSTSSYSPSLRAATSRDESHFPTLVGNKPSGAKPTLGLIGMQRGKSASSANDDAENGWVTGWSQQTANDDDAVESGAGGKKKKNKKMILFHVG